MNMVIYIVLVSSFIVLLFVLYFFLYKSKGIERIRVLEIQKEKFCKNSTNPKILIMGGSDVLYSFQTDYISKQLNMPVVNLGTNVGLGMGYLLDFTQANAQSGDIIIACIAFSLYSNPPYHVFAFEYYRMYSKRKLTYFKFSHFVFYFFGNLKLNLEYRQKKFQLGESGCYLNVHGTILMPQKNKPLNFPNSFTRTLAIKKLEEFKLYCQEKNIDFWITFPSTLKFDSYSTNNYLIELQEYLTKNYQTIGKPNDYFVELDSIYNSVYHVNEKGQHQRSEKAIYEFKQIVDGGK